MSQSTQSGRRDAVRVSLDEAEVREALLERTHEPREGAAAFAQLDGADGLTRIE
ncbi:MULTISPECIES: hypothetical protein [unclassified Curtobacterium]|jgi:hypothetical protein|uniref:hypothetical protein n=1 Tax=unclassified Curtobacterium TaxID=257496 RepID=UPI00226BB603|nr:MULTISPECIES: hypothetical protein [unclassified Curtobacterium]